MSASVPLFALPSWYDMPPLLDREDTPGNRCKDVIGKPQKKQQQQPAVVHVRKSLLAIDDDDDDDDPVLPPPPLPTSREMECVD